MQEQIERVITKPLRAEDLFDGLQFMAAGYNNEVVTLRATGQLGLISGDPLWRATWEGGQFQDFTQTFVLEHFADGRWCVIENTRWCVLAEPVAANEPAYPSRAGQWWRHREGTRPFVLLAAGSDYRACWSPSDDKYAAMYTARVAEAHIAGGDWVPAVADEPVSPPTTDPFALQARDEAKAHAELAKLLSNSPRRPETSLSEVACNEIVKLRALAQLRYDEMMKTAAARDQLYTERTQMADRCGELKSALKDKRAECDELRDRLRKLDRSPTPERR